MEGSPSTLPCCYAAFCRHNLLAWKLCSMWLTAQQSLKNLSLCSAPQSVQVNLFFVRQNCSPCKTQLCRNPCPFWGLLRHPCLSGWNKTRLSQSPVRGLPLAPTATGPQVVVHWHHVTGKFKVRGICMLLTTMTQCCWSSFPSVPLHCREGNPRDTQTLPFCTTSQQPLWLDTVQTWPHHLPSGSQVSTPPTISGWHVPCAPGAVSWFHELRQSWNMFQQWHMSAYTFVHPVNIFSAPLLWVRYYAGGKGCKHK